MGSVAAYSTTSYETIRRIHSSLLQIQSVTGGRLRGIPLKIVVRPGKTRYEQDGKMKSGIAYFVNIEFREEDYSKLVPALLQQSVQYDRALGAQRRMLSANLEDGDVVVEQIPEAEQAQAMTSEFYPDNRTQVAETSKNGAGADVDKIKDLCGKLGLNAAHTDTLFQVFKGDIDAAGAWLKEFAHGMVKLQATQPMMVELFTKAVIAPGQLAEVIKSAEFLKPADAPAAAKRTRKATEKPSGDKPAEVQQQAAATETANAPGSSWGF